MDIQIDCGSIYFGLKQLKNIESDFNSLSKSIGSVSLPSEITNASLLSSAKSTIDGIINDDLKVLIERFEETKSILASSDSKAALLFDYYEQGIIDENGNFTDVPLLTQNDYGYITYGGGTVATSGCGITSLCMVASYILNELYTPDDLAELANADRSSNVGKMTTAADYVGLNWYNDPNTSREDLINYLNEGKLVICLVKSSSHFVVCKGVTEDGKILVNDPYLYFRSSAYDDGYTWDELQFSAGNTWVFDPAANTGATTSAGTVSVSSKILDQISGIDIDGVYEETVQADEKNNTQVSTEEEQTTQEQTEQTTEDKTNIEEELSNNEYIEVVETQDAASNNSWTNASTTTNSSTTSQTQTNTSNTTNRTTTQTSSSTNKSNTTSSSTSNQSSSQASSSTTTSTKTETTTTTDTTTKTETTTQEVPTKTETTIDKTPSTQTNQTTNSTTTLKPSTSTNVSNSTSSNTSYSEPIKVTSDAEIIKDFLNASPKPSQTTTSSTNSSLPEIPNTRVDGEVPNKTTEHVVPSNIDISPTNSTTTRISYISPSLIGLSMASLGAVVATATHSKKEKDKEKQSKSTE